MAYPHNLRAPVNSRRPEFVGICRRCGFLYPISELQTQYEWRGPSLAPVLSRVCIRTCLDKPAEQLRTIIIGPDGIGPPDASPTFYDQQNAGGVVGPLSDYPFILDESLLGGGDVLE